MGSIWKRNIFIFLIWEKLLYNDANYMRGIQLYVGDIYTSVPYSMLQFRLSPLLHGTDSQNALPPLYSYIDNGYPFIILCCIILCVLNLHWICSTSNYTLRYALGQSLGLGLVCICDRLWENPAYGIFCERRV